jgi:PleD family two-component response regulator
VRAIGRVIEQQPIVKPSVLGGFPFLIVQPGCSLVVDRELAEHIRLQMAELRDPKVGQITMSFGVSEWVNPETPEVFISRVDQALYEAKRAGRNHVAIASGLCV